MADFLGVAARKRASWGGLRKGAGRKPELEDPVSVTLDLERPQAERLRAIADDRGVSLASLVRKAVDAYLQRQRAD